MVDSMFKIFTMLGGLAIFMYGMKIMGDSIEHVAGNKVKQLFSKVSNNRIKGVGIGMGVTAIIQSSSATTVMLVGFVNVGLLSLAQAAAMIMGSNIGTTVTAQISSLSALNITAIMSVVCAVGCGFFMFCKKDSLKNIGIILVGLGMLFIGLNLMSSSMKTFAFNADGSPSAFSNFMINNFSNPFLNVIAGAVFTAVIQSSSAATGVLLGFASAGVVTFNSAIFMILGMNIGTCVTAMIASIGATTNARRTAVIHLLFNIIGTALAFIPILLFGSAIQDFLIKISGTILERQIANFHTIFNVAVTLVLLPFTNQLVRLATFLVKDQKAVRTTPKRLYYLDERILATPPIAVGQALNEVKNMADIAYLNIAKSLDMIINRSIEFEDDVRKNEDLLNYLNREITNYLVKISSLDISDKDEAVIGGLFHVVSDAERIGDYAENILKYAKKMISEEIIFSDEAIKDISYVKEKLGELYALSINAFTKRDKRVLHKVDEVEDLIDKAKTNMEQSHIDRLSRGECSIESGSIYLAMASQLERVADHMTNIAYSIRSYRERIAASPKS